MNFHDKEIQAAYDKETAAAAYEITKAFISEADRKKIQERRALLARLEEVTRELYWAKLEDQRAALEAAR